MENKEEKHGNYISPPHNPKVVGSNPAPATTKKSLKH